MKILPIAAMVTVGFLLLSFPATAVTIDVPDDQPTIQAGITAASAGDTVLVACNTYYEHDIIMKSGVCLTSETGLADCVTIDAQEEGRVFYCDGVDSLASVVGFTVTGGLTTQYGGGMLCMYSSLTLTSCTFSGNQANSHGGGMYVGQSFVTLTDCTFSENESGYGGGMSCWYSSSPTLTDCTFSSNRAYPAGGGMFCSDSSPSFTNCIIAFSQPGRAVYCEDATSSPALTCCDVYGNAGGDWVGCIADQYGVSGNFSEDPLFCGDLNPDEPYTLHVGSPCAPENSQECGLIGAWGVGCGFSAVEPVSWGSIKAMYR